MRAKIKGRRSRRNPARLQYVLRMITVTVHSTYFVVHNSILLRMCGEYGSDHALGAWYDILHTLINSFNSGQTCSYESSLFLHFFTFAWASLFCPLMIHARASAAAFSFSSSVLGSGRVLAGTLTPACTAGRSRMRSIQACGQTISTEMGILGLESKKK